MYTKAILTDIEGTTTPIRFVKDVLFPYSYEKVEGFLKQHWEDDEIKDIVKQMQHLEKRDITFSEVVDLLKRWIEEDRKITPLKQLQGLIWEEGYKSGNIQSFLYEDVYMKLKEWYDNGLKIYVYSSGSVKAQKLLFSHTNYGDITFLFSGYFDTKIGSKLDSDSYVKIAKQIDVEPSYIVFLSDNPQEVEAAAQAGMNVFRVVRDGDAEYIENFPFPQISSFYEVRL